MRFILGIISALILAAALVAGGFWVTDSLCSNEVISRHASPGGEHEVVVFLRGCGATSGNSLQASVQKRGQALVDEPGNALVVDELDGDEQPGVERLRVVWDGDEAVRLEYSPELVLLRCPTTALGVSVSCGPRG